MSNSSGGQSSAPDASHPGIQPFSATALAQHGGPNAMLNSAQQSQSQAQAQSNPGQPSPGEMAAFQSWQQNQMLPGQVGTPGPAQITNGSNSPVAQAAMAAAQQGQQGQGISSAQQAALHQAAYAQLNAWRMAQGQPPQGQQPPPGQQGFVTGPQVVAPGASWANAAQPASPMTMTPTPPPMNFTPPPSQPPAALPDPATNIFAMQNQKDADAAAAQAALDAPPPPGTSPVPGLVPTNDAGSQ